MASTSLSRNTWGTATNDKIFTMSVWVKRSGLGYQQIVNSYDGSTGNDNQLKFQSTDAIELTVSTGTEYFLKTNRLFRDTSAWYHIVFAFDSTQATDSNRYKLYINGTQETSFSSVSYPPQNTTYQFFRNSNANNIGSQFGASGGFFNGQMAHFHFIDGTAYDASTFGETDATTGIWKPKTAPSVTYGTNGFFLKFENSAAFGTDSSGNGNTFTVNGTMTQTIDTPSNVFATLNPLNQNPSNAFVLQNGNLSVASSTAVGTKNHGSSTLGASSGKWYSEFKIDSGLYSVIGVSFNPSELARNNQDCGYYSSGWGYYQGLGTIRNNDSGSAYGDTLSAGDILGIALDLDNSKLYFAKNGVWQNSGDPTSGATGTGAVSITSGETYFFVTGDADASTVTTTSANFGNGFFGTTAVSSAQNPDDGIGIFEYDVPTGYRALCTKSINAEEYS
jgi:hypothetical protein